LPRTARHAGGCRACTASARVVRRSDWSRPQPRRGPAQRPFNDPDEPCYPPYFAHRSEGRAYSSARPSRLPKRLMLLPIICCSLPRLAGSVAWSEQGS
jgi:hypothetical protein